jgi:hypothetical protein
LPTQAEIFWDKKLKSQPATPIGGAVSRPVSVRYENGRRIVEGVYGPWRPLGRWCHRKHAPPQAPDPLSIATYRRIHATGHYLNRLFRRLPNEEPSEPLLKEAKADAERRYDGFCQGRVRRYQRRIERLNPISIRASKLKMPTDPLAGRDYDRQFKRLQQPINDEIWSAIQACREMFDELSEQRQLRRISEINIARLDRTVKAITPKDELIVPRGWPMQNLRGVRVPLLAPYGAMRKSPKPSIEKQESTGTKADWARLKTDMGAPLEAHDKQAAEKEDKASKEIEALVRRQRRPIRLRTFADLRPGQICADCGKLKIGIQK